MAMTTPYKIEEVNQSDYAEIATLENTVFNDDPITVYAFGPDRNNAANLAHRVKSLINRPKGCEVRMRKVVDPESGAIIGFAYWKFFYVPWIVNPPASTEGDGKDAESTIPAAGLAVGDAIGDGDGSAVQKEAKSDGSIWPEGADVELCEKVFVGADAQREGLFGGKRHATLNILVIRQSHQRRGIGKLLLDEGLVEADKHGLPCWLGSSEPGEGLYKSRGFVVDVVKEFDMRPYGGSTTEKHILMHRPALGEQV